MIFPVIASLLPVAIYHLGELQFDDEWVATLAPFGLVFYYGYFKDMPDKQIVAEFFFVLVLLTLLDDSIDVRKRALGATFGAMMILAHYGVSLLFVAFLAATIVTVAAARGIDVVETVDSSVVRPTFVVLLATGWAGWYMFGASGVNFQRIVVLGYETLRDVGTSPASRSGVDYATTSFESLIWLGYKLLTVALIGLIAVGVAWMLYVTLVRERFPGAFVPIRRWRSVGRTGDADTAYVVFASFVLLFLFTSAVMTYGMGFDRTFRLALVSLVPFALIGLRAPFRLLADLSDRIREPAPAGTANVFAAFLAVFFIVSSGAAFAAAGEEVPSYSINLDPDAGWPVYDRSEVGATRWVAEQGTAGANIAVYNDWQDLKSRDGLLVSEVVSPERIVLVWSGATELEGTPYIYVSHKPMLEERGGEQDVHRPTTDAVLRAGDRLDKPSVLERQRPGLPTVAPHARITATTGRSGRWKSGVHPAAPLPGGDVPARRHERG